MTTVSPGADSTTIGDSFVPEALMITVSRYSPPWMVTLSPARTFETAAEIVLKGFFGVPGLRSDADGAR